ncbi:LLM class flavin-dependent oxidoreductase [Nitrospirillum iridis]|uniref:FMN-dependent oxidoreductase (Nitrilotriacetate monooxygenase family) n=1 Tax=Nitrospirillum iridis TaxID=765888 RepID=A0A7X0B3Z2_9PROT|nr:LLM class flavin-dependent oxidoreductase [Nitrospirillum iridis]MBB6255303.1 FMN-dependent oxidoreductase (nitrilotriacetate monooxygenase family) [Nitrospirillum iridis]
MTQRFLKLGAFLSGNGSHGGSWRLPGVAPDAGTSFDLYRHVAQKLEAGKFDALFMNDTVSVPELDPHVLARNPQAVRWDPLTLLPALAVVTRHLGLIATANTTYNEPFTLARRFASLDQLSGGRAGWNLVTSLGGGENYNRDDHVLHAQRYERAEEFFNVITGLWDSWEDDAVVGDKDSGIYLDVDKLHVLNHKGPHFQVKGPLNAPRPPQGYPVLAQAGSSDPGRELAARTADLVFTAAQTLEEAQAFIRDVKGRAAKYGRHPDSLKVLPGVSVITAPTQAEAQAKYDQLQDLLDPAASLKGISNFINIGVDLSAHPLDGPVPLPDVIPETNTHKSRQRLVLDLIRRENPTIRQLFRKLTAGGHRILIGTPETVADDFAAWFHQGGADGFNIMFSHLPGGVDDFVDLVVPELQRRGLFRTEYEGRTLRENLGLARPGNRFADGGKRRA